MYTICQGHEPSSTNRQNKVKFSLQLKQFFLWCNNENEARADISQSDSVSNQSSGGKVTFCARAREQKKDYEQVHQETWNLVKKLIHF